MSTMILLLRGVNVGGHRKVPMAELRALCGEIGFANVRTYLASGNVIADVPAIGRASAAAGLQLDGPEATGVTTKAPRHAGTAEAPDAAMVRKAHDTATTAKALEAAIEARFGFPVDVIARRADDWRAYLDDNPFLEQSATQPNRVMLLLANRAPAPGAVEAIRERAGTGEIVHGVRDGIWIFYAEGAADTKITPAGIDKAVGAPTTSRNWRTVQALAEMASAPR